MKKLLVGFISLVLSYLAFEFWFKDSVLATIVMGSIVLHELGHAVQLIASGYKVVSVLFVPFLGAAVTPEKGAFDRMTFYHHATVSLAGPIANFVLTIGGLAWWAIEPSSNYALALMSVNISLMFFNLLPFNPFDGGRVASAIFESADEETDRGLAAGIRALALICSMALIFAKGFNISYLLIIWGISRKSESDNPSNAYSQRAMTKTQINTITLIYIFLLFGGMIAEVFAPNWFEIFHVWPASALQGVAAGVLLAIGVRTLLAKRA